MASKIMFLGLGVVPQSLMDIILKKKLFAPDDIIVIDKNEKALDFFRSHGGKEENILRVKVDKDNYMEIFEHLKRDDFLIELANDIDDLVLTTECTKRGIHFVTTSDGWFSTKDPNDQCYEEHLQETLKIARTYPKCPTSIMNFGINSGVINVLIKKALIDIVEEDDTSFVTENREHLRELIKEDKYAQLARELQVTYLIESDYDTTETSIVEPKPDTAYSTWNPVDFYNEMNGRACMIVGTDTKLSEALEVMGANVDQIHAFDPDSRMLELKYPGKLSRVKAVINDQIIEGCADDHEELHSIREYFSIWNEDGELEYAPSVIFSYLPCDIALKTALLGHVDEYHVICEDEMISGGEAIGMLVQGNNFNSRYVGTESYLGDGCIGAPPAFLVAVSIYAALIYVFKHPDSGILYPEQLDVDEIISYISPYLPVISKKSQLLDTANI
ncbi:hypothetical protein BXO88_09795 [Oribacterium sp. C9]|uniref:saccharopine dehydrogenase NADP-binding domain-containing protein n=1 Tax=Oribacterium sp. C9 TaxID=1943579 RepID=UPI00098F44BA|nr:saccharopine dehydrogenase NADP-binding domain-containing protein [Oribacterium sp. C9]OON85914.1 hypothetical protein BXO88_09795 [Oribacterium sp. C9]